jgi:hypothetical protein
VTRRKHLAGVPLLEDPPRSPEAEQQLLELLQRGDAKRRARQRQERAALEASFNVKELDELLTLAKVPHADRPRHHAALRAALAEAREAGKRRPPSAGANRKLKRLAERIQEAAVGISGRDGFSTFGHQTKLRRGRSPRMCART